MGRLLWIVLLGAGGGGLGIFLPLALGGLEWAINFGVAKQLRIIKGTETYEIWRKPPIPIYLKVRIFNLTNPEEIKTGAKPILDEVGPYVYLETLEKLDITADEGKDTLRFRQVHNYYFQPQMSNGSVEDVITFINIPFVGVAKMAHDFTDVEFMLETLDNMLSGKGETLTKTHTVREFLFDGFSVQAFLDLLKDPLVEAAGEVKIPEMIADGKMGLLKGKNGTSDGWYVIRSGKENSVDLTRLVTFDGKGAMDVWKDASCNAINGTDGMMYQPFLTKDIPLQLFIGQMCRSLTYSYTEDVVEDGVMTHRYQIPDSLYQSIQKNPDNWCFCPEKNTNCVTSINGVIPIGPCVEGAPLYISHPHFIGGDEFLLTEVVGLHPDPKEHVGFIHSHPRTGASVKTRHRFQFNMQLKQWPAMPTFSEIPNVMLPLMWMEEGADLDDKNKGTMRLLDRFLGVWTFVKWIFLLISISLFLAGGFFMTQAKKANETKQMNLLDQKLKPDLFIKDQH